MKFCGKWPIGVCSWSLKNDAAKLEKLKSDTGISHIHLAFAQALLPGGHAFLEEIERQQWQITAAMIGFPHEDYSTLDSIKNTGGIVPDEFWESNKILVLKAADLASSLGVKYLEFHFGFIDDRNIVFADRVKFLADYAAKKHVVLLMETGQETAQTLACFLERMQHPALAINFDPANMILYGKGDPIQAVNFLGKWIKHVHIKDAICSPIPGQWGKEAAWGSGQVEQNAFLTALEKSGYSGALAIEREGGETRFEDIKRAVQKLS
ncbi:MAG: Xylose isomerase-like TIM barrel [Planctomycetes bacterium ADurb.Bin401]|nr:MAG: Xylose isomerase-like TIM barrel [Planctomycetes bacterium ADurb.Bin401]